MWFTAATRVRRSFRFAAGTCLGVGLLFVPAASSALATPLDVVSVAARANVLTTVLVPVADVTVAKRHPRKNYGSSRTLHVHGPPGSQLRSYVKFRVGKSFRHIETAKLRAFVMRAAGRSRLAMRSAGSRWREASVTWRSHPRASGARHESGRLTAGRWVEWDVSSVVRSSGTYSFVLDGDSGQRVTLLSRKTRKPPKLVVTMSDTLPPTAPTGLHVEGSSASTISVGWNASSDDVALAGYRIYRDGAYAGKTTGTSYLLSALQCGTSYGLGVEAYDQTGNVSARAEIVADTTGCSPADGGTTTSDTTGTTTTGTTATTTGTTTAPSIVCTKSLAAGGDLSTFVASLVTGDTGCLHAGTYSDGPLVTWSTDGSRASRITLAGYPGEQAEVVGTELLLAGDYLTVRDVTVRDVLTTDADGVSVSGTGDSIEHTRILRTARHGILLHTSASNALVARNFVDEAGVDGGAHSSFAPSQIHGIYVQGSGHEIVRNVFARMTGYGIHLYDSPSNILVSGNTAVASATRTGLLVRTTGDRIVIADNVFDGATLHSCGGCVIDTNQVAGGWTIQDASAPQPTNTLLGQLLFGDGLYRLGAGSLAIDAGRADLAVEPDLDGRPSNGPPDLGAYER